MNVVVTGGAGFIGAHSCAALLARGHRVVAVDDLSHGKREAVPPGAGLLVADVREPGLAEELARLRPDAVLHLAAQMDVRRSVAEPAFDASVNVVGTVNTLEAARRAGARRFVLASTGGAIYGEQDAHPAAESHPRRPSSPYGVAKLCAEEYLAHAQRSGGMSALALRYANVYGPGQDPHGEAGVVAIFCERLLQRAPPIIYGDGLQTRDYVHVGDVVRANVLAVEGAGEGALNIGTGLESTVLEVLAALEGALGAPGARTHAPARPGEQRRSSVDPRAAREALGWEPRITAAAGLPETARWFAERH